MILRGTPRPLKGHEADHSEIDEGDGLRLSRAPANPLNRYVTVDADHLGTSTAARQVVLTWLKDLR
jgi:hypothetical protein